MKRRQARELALQILFQIDLGQASPETAFQYTIQGKNLNQESIEFIRRIVFGTLQNIKNLDKAIASVSRDWDLGRMATVDRNIMRMALFEIFYCEDIPGSVSLNEAIELAKIFGTDDSGRFVNGVLGKIVESPCEYLTCT
ncbi:MAG TPA: transcription antitermination factor NusB [Desulfotomaculum sp.]|nr:MAG: N utilization substance protein B-like protein [Desulfotomaculum sp. 46_80]KUK85103.1 MAG: N utilization substance protein B-like protein [Desulfofundulus kuznetsovii]HAG09916.1 transcription antitermination factor NusB [Desulfotomaculum sp.]HBY04624.1 transcription antitermination factor NusB [Desulfotomaculum sp.]